MKNYFTHNLYFLIVLDIRKQSVKTQFRIMCKSLTYIFKSFVKIYQFSFSGHKKEFNDLLIKSFV